MNNIRIKWLVSGSITLVSIITMLLCYSLSYQGLQKVLELNCIQRMDGHLRYVLGNVHNHKNGHPPVYWEIPIVHRPLEVPDDFFSNLNHYTNELGSSAFTASILDLQGRTLAKDKNHSQRVAGPNRQVLEEMIAEWNLSPLNEHSPNCDPKLIKLERHFGAPDKPFEKRPHRPSLFRPDPPKMLRVSYQSSPGNMSNITPLAQDGRIVGFVHMSSPTHHINHIMEMFTERMLLFATLIVIVSAALGITSASLISKPLNKVATVAERIGNGDLKARTGMPESDNEVNLLGHNIDIMAQQLEEMFNEQRRFIGDASHELKTPITSLMGACHVLSILDEKLPENPKRVKTMATIERELNRMEQLVSDLLTLSRNSEVHYQLPCDPVNLHDLARYAVQASLAESMERQINIDVPEERWILGDEKDLTRALRNLLDNALRYTPPDKDITLKASFDAENVTLSVIDQGCGISEDHLKHLGQRFYRADSSRARNSGGTGLGLSITKAIAQRHHGCFKLESQLGMGTTASIILPLRAEEIAQNTVDA